MTAPGTLLRTITHDGWVYAIVFSADSLQVATGDDIGVVHLSKVAADGGDPTLTIEIGGFVCGLGLTPDASRVVVANRTRLCAYDAAGPGSDPVWEIPVVHPEFYQFAVLSPDGSLFAAATHRTIQLVAVATGQVVHTIEVDQDLRQAAWSADGTRLVAGLQLWDDDKGDNIGSARIYAVPDGHEVARYAHTNSVDAVAFAPDAASVLFGSADMTARRIDAVTGEARWPAPFTASGEVTAVALAPNGSVGVVGGRDGELRVLRMSVGVQQYSTSIGGQVADVVVSDDGAWVAAYADGGAARVLQLATGAQHIDLPPTDDGFTAAALSPDSRWFAVATGSVLQLLYNA